MKKTFLSMWSDLSTHSDWSNQQSLMALVTEHPSPNFLTGDRHHFFFYAKVTQKPEIFGFSIPGLEKA